MRIVSFAGSLAAAYFVVFGALPADAAERRPTVRKVVAQPVPDRSSARLEEEYAVRAHVADPAGTYKNYPNWARVALGSRSSSR